jgi:hypothetical protein
VGANAANPLNPVNPAIAAATAAGIVLANAPAAWYEIPAESKAGSSFARVVEVGIDPSQPVEVGATYGIVIYEFNDEVILSVGNSYVQLTEHPRWADGVNKLSVILAKPESTATTKKSDNP